MPSLLVTHGFGLITALWVPALCRAAAAYQKQEGFFWGTVLYWCHSTGRKDWGFCCSDSLISDDADFPFPHKSVKNDEE